MKRRRWRRRFLATAALVAVAATGVHVLSEERVNRERAERTRSDGALYRASRGSGSPILFIPGFLGTTRYWGDSFDVLASQHRVVFVDPLGFGRSPWPEIDYTLEEHLDALHATVTQEADTSSITLVGHSFGALLAAEYAARYAGVDRVILLGLPIFESEEDAKERIGALAPLARLFVLDEHVAAASCDVLCAFRPWFEERMPAWMPDRPPEVARDGVLHTWESFDGTLRNVLLARRARAAVVKIDAPVIIIHTTNDEVTPVERARELATDAGARFVEVPGAHHAYRSPAIRILVSLRAQ